MVSRLSYAPAPSANAWIPLAEVSAGEIGADQLGATEIATGKVGVGEVGIGKVGTDEVGAVAWHSRVGGPGAPCRPAGRRGGVVRGVLPFRVRAA